MKLFQKSLAPRGCALLQLSPAVDSRGTLVFLETEADALPFAVKRVFWISGVPTGCTRGGHAHRTCHELVFAVTGACRITVDDGHCREEVLLDSPETGLLIPAGVWCTLTDFSPGAACVVLASQPYDAAGYIHEYAEFQKEYR